jgi:hypothetical protein
MAPKVFGHETLMGSTNRKHHRPKDQSQWKILKKKKQDIAPQASSSNGKF